MQLQLGGERRQEVIGCRTQGLLHEAVQKPRQTNRCSNQYGAFEEGDAGLTHGGTVQHEHGPVHQV